MAESRKKSAGGQLERGDEIRRKPRLDSFGWGPVEDLGPDIVEGVRRIKAKDGRT